MKVNEKDTLSFFSNLYQNAVSRNKTDFDKWYKQYRGDSAIDSDNGLAMQAPVVRNVTYELIESQVNGTIPTPKVEAGCLTPRNRNNARRVEAMLRALRKKLAFERLNDIDERNTYIYGSSIFLVEWDDGIVRHNQRGDVKVTLLEPQQFTPQPGIFELEQMDYCFIEYEASSADVIKQYGVDAEKLFDCDATGNDNDIINVITCYYKDEDGQLCQYVFSGNCQLKHLKNYYQRRKNICTLCGKPEGVCRCEKPHFVSRGIVTEKIEKSINLTDGGSISQLSLVMKDGKVVYDSVIDTSADGIKEALEKLPVARLWAESYNELLLDSETPIDYQTAGWVGALSNEQFLALVRVCFEGSEAEQNLAMLKENATVLSKKPRTKQTELPYYVPRSFPIVIRRNTSVGKSVFGQSDCEFIRVQQQELNKIETRIQQKLLRAGVLPFSSYDTEVEFSDELFQRGIKLSTPQELSLLGKLDLEPSVAQDMSQAERLYEQSKRVLGISDSYQGIFDRKNESGTARQIAVEQASGRLLSKKAMKNSAYGTMDRIIFELMLAYADEPRHVTVADVMGNDKAEVFSRYDFLEQDGNGEWFYCDDYLFSADNSADSLGSRSALWAENRANYLGGVYGEVNGEEARLLFWQNMERLDYPFARLMLERLTETQGVNAEQISSPDAVGGQITGNASSGTEMPVLPLQAAQKRGAAV